jgi:hypothetical protein
LARLSLFTHARPFGHSARAIASYGRIFGFAFAATPAPCVATPLSLVVTAERSPAAEDCADGAALLSKVERIAQRSLTPVAEDADAIRVRLRFERTQGEYRATLVFQGPKPGERSLRDHSDRCDPLEDAVAVAIALLLDSEIERRVRESSEAPRAVTTIRIIGARVEPRPLPAMPLRVALETGAHAGFGPTVSPSCSLAFGVSPASGWWIEPSAWVTLPTTSGYASGEVTVWLAAAGLRACRLWGDEWRWGPCAAAAVGRLHGSGRGFEESLSSSLLWSALEGSVLLQRSLGSRWELGLRASAWVLLRDQRFAVEHVGVAWGSDRIAPGLSVRLGYRFR